MASNTRVVALVLDRVTASRRKESRAAAVAALLLVVHSEHPADASPDARSFARSRSLSPQVRERVAAAFLTSSRYELAFWQMAWEGERWLA